jgi:hypothetical protein
VNAPAPIWDRDRDGPGVIRYGSLAEAIERMPMEEFAALIIALSRAAREEKEETT